MRKKARRSKKLYISDFITAQVDDFQKKSSVKP
jgi:hypothetical protein